MKRVIFIALLISFFNIQSYSQQEKENKLFFFGVGVGFGFFNPSDINEGINDYYSNTIQTFGTYDMYVYYVLNAKGSFFFSPYTELQVELEWGLSPKFVMIDDESDTWFLRRLSPALKFNVHIPTSNKVSIYFGPGVSWNSLKLNTPTDTDLKGNCIGFSGQAGVMIRFRKFAIEPFLVVNFVNAQDAEAVGDYSGTTDTDLSFTGVHLGNTFFF